MTDWADINQLLTHDGAVALLAAKGITITYDVASHQFHAITTDDTPYGYSADTPRALVLVLGKAGVVTATEIFNFLHDRRPTNQDPPTA